MSTQFSSERDSPASGEGPLCVGRRLALPSAVGTKVEVPDDVLPIADRHRFRLPPYHGQALGETINTMSCMYNVQCHVSFYNRHVTLWIPE